MQSAPIIAVVFILLKGAVCTNDEAGLDIVSPSILLNLTEPAIYDKLMAPNLSKGQVTPVYINFYVENVLSIQSSAMEYEIDFYLRTEWRDERLAYNYTPKQGFVATNDQRVVDRVWWPDIIFANTKNANYFFITIPNWLFRVFPNGSIFSSRRYSIHFSHPMSPVFSVRTTLTCPMQLHTYPFDEQKCPLKLLTYHTTTNEVNVTWKSNDAKKNVINLNKDIFLTEFGITKVDVGYCDGDYGTGIYSCLISYITFQRYLGFYVYQLFLPTGAVVSISWISFWISPKAVPARATLSITTFLALTTQTSGIRSKLPAVSYGTAVDTWSTLCTIFVYGALLEFAIAYHFHETRENQKITGDQKMFQKKNSIKPEGDEATVENEPKTGSWGRFLSASNVDKLSRVLFPLVFLVCNVVFWVRYFYV